MSPNARWTIADDAVYHIVTRGNNQMQVFHHSEDFRSYLEMIQKYKQKYPILIYNYCLMMNHVHLLVRVLRGEDLKKLMQGVNQTYSNYYSRRHTHTGHLWQGRYKSFLIEKDSYLLECSRYIERNPVRAKLIQDPGDWPWSSYRFYAFGEPDVLIDPHPLYVDLGDEVEIRQDRYREYVLVERPYESILDEEFVGASRKMKGVRQ